VEVVYLYLPDETPPAEWIEEMIKREKQQLEAESGCSHPDSNPELRFVEIEI
jgi:hypothetical protein